MTIEQKKHKLYSIALKFLTFKITNNLRRIDMDVYIDSNRILLTAVYATDPSELELELLDDIVTNTNAHIPDFFVESMVVAMKDYDINKDHDFVLFAAYDEYWETNL